MNNRFEFFSRRRVAENDFSESLAIDGAVRLENFRTEGVDDFFPARRAGLHHFPRQFIGIDDGHAKPPQYRRNGAFARRNAPGETD
jgi:hypothetical protein